MTPLIRARCDPALQARIVGHAPLYYDEPAEDSQGRGERPPYVRAGSSLAWFARYLSVVQDDANFVALIDLTHRPAVAAALPLPAGPGGIRVFDEAHKNKNDKLDLEACVTIPTDDDGALLVAFGSGSKPQREQIAVVRWREPTEPAEVSLYDGSAFYATLRQRQAFAGSALNVEGAVYLSRDRIRLFQRGNGAPRDGLQPVDATGDVAWLALWKHLEQPGSTPPPALENIVQYDCGNLQGQRLSFSDAEAVGNAILYSASAEASPDSDRDGAIQGSVLGVIDATDGSSSSDGSARYTGLRTEDGRAFPGKIEGLSVARDNPRRAYFVVDDDKDQPSELFEVELCGPWYGDTA